MYDINVTTTQFAPAARVRREQLKEQKDEFFRNDLLVQFANFISQMLVVLNKERQIICGNKKFVETLGFNADNDYLGKRPGEVLGCIHAFQTIGGCGTTEFCRTCGAVNAILESQKGNQSTKECRISTINNEALDLKITATPFNLKKHKFTLFEINDISHEKRRNNLERIFFHDVLNSAGGISGLSDVICMINDPEEITEIAGMIHESADNLINDIQAQKQLVAAERNDLKINLEYVNSEILLKGLVGLYSNHEVAVNKRIQIDETSENFSFKTDIVLFRRILGNMTKNALEASGDQSTITLRGQHLDNKLIFSVHNPTYIERSVQLQLFKRSFSTKGNGRGLGTYSMKLFGEKYLKGKVWFKSSKERGTFFFLEL